TPGELRLVAQSAAGRPAGATLAAGEAFGISTGAVVPDGADAVVPVERTAPHGDTVLVAAVSSGENVRPRGGDLRAGGGGAGARVGRRPCRRGHRRRRVRAAAERRCARHRDGAPPAR